MSGTIRMKATDTLHMSAVRAGNIAPGEEFEVSSPTADDLEKRGLAKRVSAKAAAPVENKDEGDAPANRAMAPVSNKTTGRRKG